MLTVTLLNLGEANAALNLAADGRSYECISALRAVIVWFSAPRVTQPFHSVPEQL